MNNKKRIVNLEYFRDMLHICLRSPNQSFDELPFEEEILAFLRNLGHSREIKKITDGMYHKKNVDFAYPLWEDFVYQVEHNDAKKSNEMYYRRFTKVIINFFMTRDPSILKRNKVNWHYARDDQMFTTIKIVSRYQNTQQFGAILPIELTNEDIRNSVAYKEYYAITSGAKPPKTKASVRKMKSSSDTTMPPPVALTKAEQMKLATKKSLTRTHISQASRYGIDEGTSLIPGVPDVPTYESDKEISWESSEEDDDDDDVQQNNDGDEFIHLKFSTYDEEAKDEESLILLFKYCLTWKTLMMKAMMTPVMIQVLEDTLVTLTPVNPDDQQQSLSMTSQFVSNMLNPIPDTGIDSIFESTPQVDILVANTVKPLLLTAPTLPSPSIPIISQVQQAPAPSPSSAPSTSLQDLPNFGSLFGFDHRLKTLEANFSEFMQTNQFAEAVSSILGIVDRYINHRINEAIKVAVQF
uniref:SPK domain-containing protein n=1 Tax=Tanacetum cinerariifolium TaxID=118510 RepID=A0A6L2KAC6_TANCI|nr:hypothetical protein [Tanacetum cinerariifolium]